jgi:hypothetical protein
LWGFADLLNSTVHPVARINASKWDFIPINIHTSHYNGSLEIVHPAVDVISGQLSGFLADINPDNRKPSCGKTVGHAGPAFSFQATDHGTGHPARLKKQEGLLMSIGNRTPIALVLVLAAIVGLNGCIATSTTQSAPPMAKRAGEAPTVAMLPVGNTNDQTIADLSTQHIQQILQDRNVFTFVDKGKVDRAVAQTGVDMTSMFGLSESEYKALAAKLEVDYLLHGFIGVRKTLKFTGWRKDVDIWLKMYNGSTGKKVDSWRSLTDFTWTNSGAELDATQMAESAANHICSKMMEGTF